MTRINSAIPPRQLTDEHLLAEHREIKRLPYCLNKAILSGSINRIPQKFTLGKGHVLFFLNKMQFVKRRYITLHAECLRRGFSVTDYITNFEDLPQTYLNDYHPTLEEQELLTERISDRLLHTSKKHWHYEGKPLNKEESVKLLTNIFTT